MTQVKVDIKDKIYTFKGDNAKDALKSVKISTVPVRLVRILGLSLTKQILWPTFSSLDHNPSHIETVSFNLPESITKILNKNIRGNLSANLDMSVQKNNFKATGSGKFDANNLDLGFETRLDQAEEVGVVMRDVLNLLSSYNINVKEIKIKIDGNKNANISLEANVPENLSIL